MGGAQGIQAAGSGFRAAVYAWLEDISFRAGLITASIALVVLAALTTAGVLAAGLGQGTQHADASPAVTSHAAAATASAPPASSASTPRPVPSGTQQASTQQATQSPVTADTTAPQAAATPQATAYSPTAAQGPAAQGPAAQGPAAQGHGSRSAGTYSRWQQPGSFSPGFGRQGSAFRLGGFIGSKRLPG